MLSFRRAATKGNSAKTGHSAAPVPLLNGSYSMNAQMIVEQCNAADIVESAPAEASRSLQDRISERAYFRWCEAGQPPGRDVDYWLTAEHEVLAEIATARRQTATDAR